MRNEVSSTSPSSSEPLSQFSQPDELEDWEFKRPLPSIDQSPIRSLSSGSQRNTTPPSGPSGRSLDEALQYALTREQFERVIGSFQAVKHMYAENLARMDPVGSLPWYTAVAWECDMQLWFKRAGYNRRMFGTPTAMRERATERMAVA